MKKFLTSIDASDVQLVTGISSLGYGLFLVSPSLMFIVIGSIALAPLLLPSLVALWRAK